MSGDWVEVKKPKPLIHMYFKKMNIKNCTSYRFCCVRYLCCCVRQLLKFICEQYWWILNRVRCAQVCSGVFRCVLHSGLIIAFYCSSHGILRQWSLNHKKPSGGYEYRMVIFSADQVFFMRKKAFRMVSEYKCVA